MKNEAVITKESVVFGLDSVVIRKFISGIPGGRTLDCNGVAETILSAGHVIIKTQEGNYAPMPVADGKYAALPSGASYVGVLVSSIPVKNPAAAIMVDGIVNSEVLPYAMTEIMTAFKTACPHIIFQTDEEA